MTISTYLFPALDVKFDRDVMAIANQCGVSYFEVVGKSRKTGLIIARQASCYVLKRFRNLSYPKIGSIMNMDHSTVIYAVRTFQDDLLVNRSRVAHLLSLIENYNHSKQDFLCHS